MATTWSKGKKQEARSVGEMLTQREVLRQRKQRQYQEAKLAARTDGLERHLAQKSWRYTVGKRRIGQREQRQQQGAKQTAGSKADRGSECRDVESTEKCSRYADAKRGTKAEEAKAISGSKVGSENRWMETRFGIEVMEI